MNWMKWFTGIMILLAVYAFFIEPMVLNNINSPKEVVVYTEEVAQAIHEVGQKICWALMFIAFMVTGSK